MSESDRKGTVLIVDDEPNVLWFISKICQPMGYETLTAGSGPEALRYIQECGEKIDLVLLDLKMPEMDGITVLKKIRENLPKLPVIVLTAAHEKIEECQKIGIEAFIKKPYSLEDLYASVEAVVQRKNVEQQESTIDEDAIPSARLLIVDDEKKVCELLTEAIYEEAVDVHYEIRWVTSGEEALGISQEYEPDIAIIDMKMATMWGDELIRRFKEGEGHCPRDFVIYSSSGDPGAIERAQKLEHEFLAKPTDLDVLLESLKQICVRHHLLKKREE